MDSLENRRLLDAAHLLIPSSPLAVLGMSVRRRAKTGNLEKIQDHGSHFEVLDRFEFATKTALLKYQK